MKKSGMLYYHRPIEDLSREELERAFIQLAAENDVLKTTAEKARAYRRGITEMVKVAERALDQEPFGDHKNDRTMTVQPVISPAPLS